MPGLRNSECAAASSETQQNTYFFVFWELPIHIRLGGHCAVPKTGMVRPSTEMDDFRVYQERSLPPDKSLYSAIVNAGAGVNRCQKA